MNTIWGICALNHDASITVIRDNKILFAGHSERYSKIKNDPHLHANLIEAATKFGQPDRVVWFERPIIKKTRQAFAHQWDEVMSVTPSEYLKNIGIDAPVSYINHHESHAAAGYFTSGFTDAAVVIVDSIGEWNTISVWKGSGPTLSKIYSANYPNSLGLLYSSVTHRVGLKPNEEEYILMGMAAYGTPKYYNDLKSDFIRDCTAPAFKLKKNLHKGMKWWRSDISSEQDFMDLAASVQKITEEFMCGITEWARKEVGAPNLVLMGGCALNCVANEKVARLGAFERIWIMPNPGDAGSSLGAALAYTKQHVTWESPYLGTNIDRTVNINEIVSALVAGEIVGIANGKAEFGPRALGNRSLLADPRGADVKNKVNDIKHRQRFRPFSPMVLEEHVHDYFDMSVVSSPYMQYTAQCIKPDLFPAICHIDGSSRVQTLTYEQNPVMHAILAEFYKRTGCPMLLNTSLNIKGQPLVDDWADAQLFQTKYNVRIF